MRQHSNLPERKCVETGSADGVIWAATVSPKVTPNWQLQIELQHERCLNRLGERFSRHITDYLANPYGQDEIADEIEGNILQTLLEELGQVLGDKQVAIFYPKTPIEALSEGSNCTTQDMPSQASETVWQIKVDQSLLGCLLLHSNPVSPSLPHSHLPILNSQLVERAIDQCVQALRQINIDSSVSTQPAGFNHPQSGTCTNESTQERIPGKHKPRNSHPLEFYSGIYSPA
ncbi:hypothetical protein K9N68_00910 [Kovacikia minuta CCNUW1]|uniref:hypothetical protein n=1 Tax=Kovacikia minuta TaxID=2931930 RepID=UPI001CD02D4B|nr:hypothetical protein K9N68_00910 [Kovacikia minuta CCNUW1]